MQLAITLVKYKMRKFHSFEAFPQGTAAEPRIQIERNVRTPESGHQDRPYKLVAYRRASAWAAVTSSFEPWIQGIIFRKSLPTFSIR